MSRFIPPSPMEFSSRPRHWTATDLAIAAFELSREFRHAEIEMLSRAVDQASEMAEATRGREALIQKARLVLLAEHVKHQLAACCVSEA